MTPDARFTEMLDDLKMLGVTQSPFFGRRGITADGKVIAVFLDDSVAFKLGAATPEHDERARAVRFRAVASRQPGSPVQGLGARLTAHQDHWGRFAELALHHIRQKL